MDETRLKDLLFDALERPAAERGAFLDAACAGDSELRARVAGLLAAHEEADAALGDDALGLTPLAERARSLAAADELGPGDTVGPYTLAERLGEGGFGTVFRAEQREPVRRSVALKLIRPGMDSAAVIARFEAERQALALMDHPGIARVLDAGSTSSGRPYFVMELVDGEPITDWCARRELPLAGRLALFAAVCHALQHAHQKGVVHRDVKPGNVLVTEVDGRPLAKVIDFGIAKALRQPLGDGTQVTVEGVLVGTPGCMSPEQVEQRADVDTRADVYALGVLLYELVCGAPPFQAGDGGLAELTRAVCEDVPLRPGLRRRRGAGDARRGVPGGERVPVDVDWVVMKCLEKERERRYATAQALALDVERLVDERPVDAAPPSTLYRVRRLAGRHRAAVLLGAASLLLLVAGGVGTTLGYLGERDANARLDLALERETQEARRARDAEALAIERLQGTQAAERLASEAAAAAEVARGLAEQRAEQASAAQAAALASAEQARDARQLALERAEQASAASALADERAREADRRARIAEAVTAFLTDDLLAAAAPSGTPGRGRDVKVRDVLGIASGRASMRFPDEPLVESAVRHALGLTYAQLGLHDEAVAELGRALELAREASGEQALDSLLVAHSLADVQRRRGRWEAARRQLDETRPRLEALLGPTHRHVLQLRLTRGRLLWESGRWQDAYVELGETERLAARELGDDDPVTLEVRGSLAVLAMFNGDTERAEQLFRSSYEAARRRYGARDPDTLANQVNLANFLRGTGEFAEAETLYEDALQLLPAVVGPEHPDTLKAAQGLGRLLVELGRVDDGLAWLEPAAHRAIETLGAGHADALELRSALVRAYERAGRLAEAEALATQVLQDSRATHGDQHPDTLQRGKELASVLYAGGRVDEFEPLMRWVHDGELALLGPDHRKVLVSARDLALADVMRGRLLEAESELRTLLVRTREALGPDDLQTLATESDLAGVLLELDRGREAEQLLVPLVERLQRFDPSGGPRMAEALERLGRALALQGRDDEARPLLDEAERRIEALDGPDGAWLDELRSWRAEQGA